MKHTVSQRKENRSLHCNDVRICK